MAAPAIPAGERIYAIGDIHGRLDLFERLVALIRADAARRLPARARLILLGDVIDRGPDSASLIDRCRAMALRSERFVMLKGNHEAMMVDALRGSLPALRLWLRHGGAAALASWGADIAMFDDRPAGEQLHAARQAVPAAIVTWLDALPLTHEAGDYLFVHAGIRPGTPLAGQRPQDLLWIRDAFLLAGEDHGRIVVHGHSISTDGMVTRPNRIGIDTGAYRTGVLTALALEGAERWSLATDGG